MAIPALESPDEISHWLYTQYVHEHWSIPPFDEFHIEGTQPPLYYFLVAPFAAHSELPGAPVVLDTSGNPVSCCREPLIFAHQPGELSRMAPLRITRLATALLCLAAVFFTYRSARVVGANPWVAMLAGCFMAFLPQFSFRASSVNNDAGVATFSAACSYFILSIYARGFTWTRGALASVTLALAFLSKVSAISLAPALFLALWKTGDSPVPRWKRLAVTSIAAIVVAPWIIRNTMIFGEPLATKAAAKMLWLLVQPKHLNDPFFTTEFPQKLWQSFLGYFGHMNGPMPSTFYYLLAPFFLAGALGVLVALVRRKLDPYLAAMFLAPLLTNIVLVIHYNLTYTQPQGRFLFPNLCFIAVFTALGIRRLLGARRAVYITVAASLLAVNLSIIYFVILPTHWGPRYYGAIVDLEVGRATGQQAAGPLGPNTAVRQTFRANHDGLERIEVAVATYLTKLTGGMVRLTLFDTSNPIRPIAAHSVPVDQIVDNGWIAMDWDPIQNSKGREYEIAVTAAEIPPGQVFSVWLSAGDAYPAGKLSVGQTPHHSDLLFRTFYRHE